MSGRGEKRVVWRKTGTCRRVDGVCGVERWKMSMVMSHEELVGVGGVGCDER